MLYIFEKGGPTRLTRAGQKSWRSPDCDTCPIGSSAALKFSTSYTSGPMHSTRGWPRVQPCHEVHHALFAHLSEAKRLEPFHRYRSAEIISPVHTLLETAVPVCMGGEKERSMHISTARVPEGENTGHDSHGLFDLLPRWPSSFSQSLARYVHTTFAVSGTFTTFVSN